MILKVFYDIKSFMILKVYQGTQLYVKLQTIKSKTSKEAIFQKTCGVRPCKKNHFSMHTVSTD